MHSKLNHFLLPFILLFMFIGGVKSNTTYTKDTLLINKLYSECKAIVYTDPEATSTKIDSIIIIAERINYKKALYNAYNMMGVKYYMLNDHQAAIGAYFKALKFADNNKKDQYLRLCSNISSSYSVLNKPDSSLYYLKLVNKQSKEYNMKEWYSQSILNLGFYYLRHSNYTKAAAYLNEAKDIIQDNSDSIFILKAYSAIATFYKDINNFDSASYYYQKAIQWNDKLTNINLKSLNTSSLGELYFRSKQEYDTAIYLYNKSVELSAPFERATNKLLATINIGNVFIEKGDIDSSFYYYSIAYKDTLIQYYPIYQAAIYTNLGYYYLKKNKHKMAEKFLVDGLSLSKDLSLLEYQENALKHLWTLEKKKENYKQALNYHEKYMEVEQALQDKEALNKLAFIEYEKFLVGEKYKNSILKAENSKQQAQLLVHRIIIGVAVLLVIILLVFLFLLSKKRKEIRTLNKGLKKNYAAITRVNKALTHQEFELRDMLASKDRFVSILGHDLKNPFSGLLGLLELMDADWDEMGDEEKKESISMLYNTSVQTYQLLEDLLDWGKTQQGMIKKEVEKVNLYDLLNEVINIFKIQLKKKNLKIEIDIPTELIISTDIKLSSQIFQNFVGNAIKYSDSGSSINIHLDKASNNYKICVVDKGIGIPSNKLQMLFNIDSNFNRPGTNNEKSTGMGLILCKEYANIIGAKIDVKSEDGKGSAFCLTIDKVKL